MKHVLSGMDADPNDRQIYNNVSPTTEGWTPWCPSVANIRMRRLGSPAYSMNTPTVDLPGGRETISGTQRSGA
jgi:hypothetical protein